MKTGRLAESVLKRSVLKWLNLNKKQNGNGAGIGENCAVFSLSKEAKSTDTGVVLTVYGNAAETREEASRIIITACNRFAASGAVPAGTGVSLLIPGHLDEEELRELVKQVAKAAEELGMPVGQIQVLVSNSVLQPILQVTVLGSAEPSALSKKSLEPGMDLVISKWIGLEGTFRIAQAKQEELHQRFPQGMIGEAAALEQFFSVIPEAATAIRSGACAMYYPDEGGIFGALWEMAEGAGVGLDIELKKLPIRQETVEICEFYEISPYELAAGGCLIMAAPNGYDLVRALEKEGIPAAVVGKAIAEKKRILRNEEEIRFLEPPRTDEIHKVL